MPSHESAHRLLVLFSQMATYFASRSLTPLSASIAGVGQGTDRQSAWFRVRDSAEDSSNAWEVNIAYTAVFCEGRQAVATVCRRMLTHIKESSKLLLR